MALESRQEVMITMKSAQRVDDARSCAETFARGCVREKDGTFFIEYTEPDEEAEDGSVRTVIELAPDGGVLIQRSGTSINCYRISLEHRHVCTFASSVGELMFGFTGREIAFEHTPQSGRLFLRYELDTNGFFASENEIDLKYTVLEN